MNGGIFSGKMFLFMELLVDEKFPINIFLKRKKGDEISLLFTSVLPNQFRKLSVIFSSVCQLHSEYHLKFARFRV